MNTLCRWLLMSFTFVILVACSTNELPTDDDFQVQVRTVSNVIKANQDAEIVTELINTTKTTFMIYHAAPLILVQAYDDNEVSVFKYLVLDQPLLIHKIKPSEIYDPQIEWYPDDKRTIKIEKPGNYHLVGTAKFTVKLKNGETKEYEIKSEPFEIEVVE